MDFQMDLELGMRLLLSFLIGTAIGLEREYRNKAAGLRTMIMICLGSTIFTEISLSIGSGSPDRIASNIITGIGFLGAGVIFKDTVTISGITTATTIWISAALGMAVGAGEYFIALVGSAVVLVVLTWFEKIKLWMVSYHQERTYRIAFQGGESFIESFNAEIRKASLHYRPERDMKLETHAVLVYEISGREKRFHALHNFLKNDARVKSYEY